MRIVAIIEARMGSSRLPGKVLADVHGKPAIQRLVDRLGRCKSLSDIVVATTTNPKDDALEQWAEAENVNVYRGSEDDVLERVFLAAKAFNADAIVEINGDCVLTDPAVVDLAVSKYRLGDVDVVTNCGNQLTYPMGVYAQVFSVDALGWVEANIKDDKAVREHVSLYFYEHPEKYQITEILAEPDIAYPGWRFQLDYPEDLQFINEVYKALEPQFGENFVTENIVRFLKGAPEILSINSCCVENQPRPA